MKKNLSKLVLKILELVGLLAFLAALICLIRNGGF